MTHYPMAAFLAVTLVFGCGPPPRPVAPIYTIEPEPVVEAPMPSKPLTKKEQASKDASDKAEAERQLRASDDAWKVTQAQEGFRAQCEYEVAGNPMILQGGWLYQAATQNQLFALCMRAKGAY